MMKLIKKISFIILSLICITSSLFFYGCTKKNMEPVEKTEYMLGTICSITVFDGNKDQAISAAFKRIKDIENKMSVNKEGTELDAIGDKAGKDYVKVSDDTLYVLQKGKYYSEQSGGVFDITVGPLVKLWGIGTDKAKVPSLEEINEKKALINYRNLIIDEKDKKVMLNKAGMSLDLGGIAKGYAADEAARILKENDVKHAIVNLGGNILAINDNPEGRPWGIGIQNPFEPRGGTENALGVVNVSNKTVVTSGIYERFVEKDGKKYHHILNPFTGYPMDNSLASVTIVTDVSIDADAATKNIFFKGIEKGPEYIKTLKGVEAIFVTKNKEVYVTDGLKENFKLTNNEFKLLNKKNNNS